MTAAFIPPVVGNCVIVLSTNAFVSTIGCYLYFLGMDTVMLAMLNFTSRYCDLKKHNRLFNKIVLTLVGIDVVSYILNPFFHHAFTTEKIIVENAPYYRLVPLIGQAYHRIVDYGILAAVIVIFIYKTVRSPRIYSERYGIILGILVLGALWQTFYIFSRTPVDRSMIGFGVFGVSIFYFALYYRPQRLLDQMLANIASEMPESLFFFDASGRCIWANPSGIALAELKDGNFAPAGEFLTGIFGDFEDKPDHWSEKYRIMEDDGFRHYVIEKHLVADKKQRIAGSFLSIRDNTEEQRNLQREIYNATHDNLTGLFTREYLYEQIRAMIDEHPEIAYQIVFVDVKNFKIVNDIFSNAFGDYALQCIADWLRNSMSELSVYGRLAGDTFGICVPTSEFDPRLVEDELSQFVVRSGNVEYHILIHLGVYVVTESELDISVMFDRAHLALSTIQEEYQTHIAYYDDEIRNKVLWNQHISSQLHQAIIERQMQPYLQPIVDKEGKVIGAEALVRWIHPADGFLSPGLFIPVFEKNGMIVEVDKYMWRCACEILSRWKKNNIDLFISVNISPKDFYFMDVNEAIEELIDEFEIEPDKLRIEITETVMMTEAEDRMRIINRFREAGFIVEMDDFGSGYSSLNLLKDLNFDVVKIDMQFLKDSERNMKAGLIINHIINMAEDLGMETLTEGVETAKQFEKLFAMGCKLYQGYYFSKPVPLADFEKQWFD
jgi:diguanylate cyclase (GGDEF)-like protein